MRVYGHKISSHLSKQIPKMAVGLYVNSVSSQVAAPFCIPTSNEGEFPSLHILPSNWYCCTLKLQPSELFRVDSSLLFKFAFPLMACERKYFPYISLSSVYLWWGLKGLWSSFSFVEFEELFEFQKLSLKSSPSIRCTLQIFSSS